MLTPKEHFHGSDLEKIEEIYHIRKEDIINFGANVNPLGISDNLRQQLSKHLDAITGYPDREYTSLRNTIAEYCQCKADRVIVGNGSTELISQVIRTVHPKKALIVSPAYSEYEREVKLSNGEITYFPLHEKYNFVLQETELFEALSDDVSLLILCNPNNPTSSTLHHDKLRNILEYCSRNHIFVMIDETYVEFAPFPEDVTAISLTDEYDNMIVLRGISKFFAAPGLRLGYAVTSNRALRAQIDEQKNPWSINSLAVIAAQLMFTDTDYIEKTRHLIQTEREKITKYLSELPQVKYYVPEANFILVRFLIDAYDASSLFDFCIRRHLMIRDCATFTFLDEQYFRFCIMNPEDNDRLLLSISDYIQSVDTNSLQN